MRRLAKLAGLRIANDGMKPNIPKMFISHTAAQPNSHSSLILCVSAPVFAAWE